MVISAEPPPPPPTDPVADAAVVEAAAAATSNARQPAAFSSFPSLKTWGSHRAALRCAHVNRGGGDAIATATATAAARRSPGKLVVAGEKASRHLNEVEAGSSDAADAGHVAAAEGAPEPAAAASPPWKLRTRRRPKAPAPSASPSPPPERRPSRARAEALDRSRFSATLTSEEIEEDIYALTGARPRRRPKRRSRAVQKQVDMVFPGSWLSEITAETYRVPDDR